MPGETTISKQPTEGFSDYLDFDALRSESIAYLGKLAGKIWTDHNVHDPGITTLEVLCYAVLDLGYRTNLPAVDIFMPDPKNKQAENNFFTPAQVLTCNPLTITDFRKLLIDIPGVINAWLEIATGVDPEKICPDKIRNDQNKCHSKRTIAEEEYKKENPGKPVPVHYLNGLYHVYVHIDKTRKEQEVIKQVGKTLMAHRNICEDFINITVLCEEKIGLCAEIEIEPGAEIEKIYLEAIQQVREYFSPSPKFYTLENLLVEKQKSIDEIFAGRPHGLAESHGFVDTEEFEKLELRKKLYLSDLYSVLQKVPGVVRVSKLQFNKCGRGPLAGWEYQLQKNHVPALELQCTSISFTSKGLSLPFDTKQYADLLELDFVDNGKVLYQSPSKNLDTEIPTGVYYKDLQQYIPIQNEFPKVYGITDGSLPVSASPQRIAKSRQFRAYLFFFDQLLANYLAQLQNVRSIFSFAPATAPDKKRTYFSNQVTMNGLQDLVRFNVEDGPGFMGTKGSPVAFPVSKKELLDAIEKGHFNLHNAKPFTFKTVADCKVAMHQVQNDISLGEFEFQFAANKDECVYYYLLTSSDEMAIVGKKYFGSQADAKRVTETLGYAGLFDENYRSFMTPGKEFSFNLEMNLFDYSRYLDRILENEDIYLQRRKSFLDHLLLRFAEQFSDYALLSYKSNPGADSREQEIAHKEKYLSNYDVLSSNRGKAYDYCTNGWNNGNASGFENRVNALLGVAAKGKQALCNFELFIKYAATFRFEGQTWFTSGAQFALRENAVKEARDMFNALADPASICPEKLPNGMGYGIRITYGANRNATGYFKEGMAFDSQQEAADTIKRLSGIFHPEIEVGPGSSLYRAIIKKLEDESVVFTLNTPALDKAEVRKSARGNLSKLTTRTVWNAAVRTHPKKMVINHDEGERTYLLDDILFSKYNVKLSAMRKPKGSAAYKVRYSIEKTGKRLQKFRKLLKQHTYFIEADEGTATWVFRYRTGILPGELYSFKSIDQYSTSKEAEKAGETFYQYPGQPAVVRDRISVLLERDGISARLEGTHDNTEDVAKKVEQQLKIAEKMRRLQHATDLQPFEEYVPNPDKKDEKDIYGYRLVDKNNLYAVYREHTAGDKLIDKVYGDAETGYNYLQLQLTGDVTIERTDDRKRIWYHYQFRSLNEIKKPGLSNEQRQLVLFESVKGYRSAIEAMEAYQHDFSLLLEKGMQFENYGDDKLISLREIFERNDFTGRFGKALVRVPKETIDFLGGYEEQGIQQLINVVKSYPVRSREIKKDHGDCFELFPPQPEREDECNKPCDAAGAKTVYYFVLFNKNDAATEDWQSVRYYDTAAEAMTAFNFFVFLLRYKGNYTIDCDCNGKKRIFIREVLAESVEQFSEENAWGENGVLKFICVAQAQNSFHYRQSAGKQCCHSFDVGCNTLVHPCRYDTQEARDKALDSMHSNWGKHAIMPFKADGPVIKNANGNVIANILQKGKYALEIVPGRSGQEEAECHADWLSDYCYNQDTALTALKENFGRLLTDRKNYKPVFDCTCGSYGIDLYEPIAFNPQCYPSTEMACAAGARALSLINSEGLHFLEHILLRPRNTSDCADQIPVCCNEFDGCSFTWDEESDDACKKAAPPVWFLPGDDPYSFVATAVLPAWPERFRKKEGRLMMEDLLRREAPAHVMLRVLWLTPHDLFRFEHAYRQWTHRRSETQNCLDGTPPKTLIDLLFSTGFHPLHDCHACTCAEEPVNAAGCFADQQTTAQADDFGAQLDELYCWRNRHALA